MISEPELTGGPEEPPLAEVIGDPGSEPRPAAARGGWGRRPLVWGLGGVVLASAVWAGGVRAYERHRGGGPDMHGYVLADSPCAGRTLAPLTTALHVTDAQSVSPAAVHLGHALDQIRCTVSAAAPAAEGDTGTARYELFVGVDLHKATDPRPDFDDQRGLDTTDLAPVDSVTAVPGLGDEAYLLTISAQTQELRVLHGGAVFTLTVTGYNSGALTVSPDDLNALHGGDGGSAADMTRLQPALIGSMRDVMAGQRHTSP